MVKWEIWGFLGGEVISWLQAFTKTQVVHLHPIQSILCYDPEQYEFPQHSSMGV